MKDLKSKSERKSNLITDQCKDGLCKLNLEDSADRVRSYIESSKKLKSLDTEKNLSRNLR